MELKLTYDGPLWGSSRTNTRATHKHDIRRVFHPQLKRFWEIHPLLKSALARSSDASIVFSSADGRIPFLWEKLAEKHECFGYNFVPLAREDGLICSLHVLFLRPEPPGSIVVSGDIDNRLKSLFDALRMPHNKDELGGGVGAPTEDEKPFYVLLEDDKVITHLEIETGTLLQRVGPTWDDNHVRLVISVDIKPAYGMFLYD